MPTVTRRAALLSPLLCAAPPGWESRAEDRLDRRGGGLTFEQFIQAALDEYVVPVPWSSCRVRPGPFFSRASAFAAMASPMPSTVKRASRSPR